MTFQSFRQILDYADLWKYIAELYDFAGQLENFDDLLKATEGLLTSEKAFILALAGVYHDRDTITFTELNRALNKTHREDFAEWWTHEFYHRWNYFSWGPGDITFLVSMKAEGSDIIEKIELNEALIILRESYPKMLDRDMVRALTEATLHPVGAFYSMKEKNLPR